MVVVGVVVVVVGRVVVVVWVVAKVVVIVGPVVVVGSTSGRSCTLQLSSEHMHEIMEVVEFAGKVITVPLGNVNEYP